MYWHYTNILKSIYLSKNYLDTISEIPCVKKVKIRIFFSKKLVRSTVLLFWFLFLIFGKKSFSRNLIKPAKRVTGLGTKQSISNIVLYNMFDIYSFIDKWTKGLSRRNLIYLRKRFVSNGSVFLQYSKVIRPQNYTRLIALDPGVDYFVSKVGFFQLYFTFWYNAKKMPVGYRTTNWVVDLENVDENVVLLPSISSEIFSKESTDFYLKSLAI